MIKKLLATTVTAGLLAGQTAAATAAPSVAREPTSIAIADESGFEASTPVLIALFVLIGAGIIYLIDENDDEDLPTSP